MTQWLLEEAAFIALDAAVRGLPSQNDVGGLEEDADVRYERLRAKALAALAGA